MKKYQVIYCDPPWRYSNKRRGIGGGAEDHYPTMSDDELKKLKVKEISDKDSSLFIWVTFPKLDVSIDVIKCWGFRYKTIAFNWIKSLKDGSIYTTQGMNHYTKNTSEICLIATKGNPKVLRHDIPALIVEPRTIHSEKPDIARDRIVELMGDVPRIELFARKQSKMNLFGHDTFNGWDVWGNEVKSDITL